jgi:hypothetical protein
MGQTNLGKRSNFARLRDDYYRTPYEAVLPLLPHISEERFCEPCAGNGTLIRHLERHGHRCLEAWDKNPRRSGIRKGDARSEELREPVTCFITNPPWTREVLHAIIGNLVWQKRTWLLFDADWMHTKQAADFMPLCSMIVSVGRIKWIEKSDSVGKDNACWYRFDPESYKGPVFIGR